MNVAASRARRFVALVLGTTVAVSPAVALPVAAAEPALSVSDRTVTEGATTSVSAVFTVRLSAPSSSTVTVVYATANATAISPGDYTTLGPATLSFAPGVTSRTIAVTVRADALDEPAERFAVQLSQPSGATIADGTGNGIVIDSDPPPGVAATDRRVVEGSSGQRSVSFTVTLSGPSGKTVAVPYTTTDGTAIAGEDYLARSGTLTFPPGVTSATVSVPVIADTRLEQDETFGLWLQLPTNGTLSRALAWSAEPVNVSHGSVKRLVRALDGRIWVTDYGLYRVWRRNADGSWWPRSAALPFAIAGGPDGSIWYAQDRSIVRVASNGSAAPYSFPLSERGSIRTIAVDRDGNAWFTHVSLRAIGRVSPQGATRFFPLPSGAGPAEGITLGPDGALWFTEPSTGHIGRVTTAGTITRFALPAPLVAPYGIVAGTDGRLWFTDRSADRIGRITTSGEVVSFPLPHPGSAPFQIARGPDDLLWFTQLGRASLGRVSNDGVLDEVPLLDPSLRGRDVVAGADGAVWLTHYQVPVVGRLRAEATATIVDDDPAIAISDASVVEGDFRNATMVFQVALSAPAWQAVRVDVATADGTAQAGEDYVAAAGTLEFAIGQRVREVRITVKADLDRERGNESFRVLLANLRGASMADPEGIGTIVEDD